MTNEDIDRMMEQAVREAAPQELYKYPFARIVAAAEQTAVLQTVEEFMGSEKERHPMFSDGYDYALSHIHQFVKGRQT